MEPSKSKARKSGLAHCRRLLTILVLASASGCFPNPVKDQMSFERELDSMSDSKHPPSEPLSAWFSHRKEEMEARFAGVKAGMSEGEVAALMGPPVFEWTSIKPRNPRVIKDENMTYLVWSYPIDPMQWQKLQPKYRIYFIVRSEQERRGFVVGTSRINFP